LITVIPLAFEIAESGRPGPVVIDIPKDIQQHYFEIEKWPLFNIEMALPKIEQHQILKIISEIHQSQRPIMLIGGGIMESNSEMLLLELSQKNSIPVISTLRGLGSMNSNHPNFLGMIGMHGSRLANNLIEEADLVLALGIRFDDRATGKVSEFIKNAKIIHIDIDTSEIDKIKTSHLSIHGHLVDFLAQLLIKTHPDERKSWMSQVQSKRIQFPPVKAPNSNFFHPLNIIDTVAKLVPCDTLISTDVGQHQMWVAMRYPFSTPRTFLTSGGLGTMGFGLPVAMGAALANPNKKTLCFTGDGSLMMNIQELATLGEQKANVCILLFNNESLGLVRQQQELFYGGKYIASKFESKPDFIAIAKGFGILAMDLSTSQNPLQDLKKALDFNGPYLLNISIDQTLNVLPMVIPGKSNETII
jgi:acetolactate synthase I/II/III large subunit